MSAFSRWLMWTTSGTTGVTGAAYWWMKYRMVSGDPWAAINHPLQPWMLKIHILAAPAMVFSIGLIGADHIWRHYRQGGQTGRRSGLTAMWAAVPMVLTGYLLQVTTSTAWLQALSWMHLATGGIFVAGLVAHHRVFRGRPAVSRRNGKGATATLAVAAPSKSDPAKP